MKELMLFLAEALPKEKLVEQIETSISQWKASKSDDDFMKIGMACALLMSKISNERFGRIMNHLKELEKLEKAHNLISKETN